MKNKFVAIAGFILMLSPLSASALSYMPAPTAYPTNTTSYQNPYSTSYDYYAYSPYTNYSYGTPGYSYSYPSYAYPQYSNQYAYSGNQYSYPQYTYPQYSYQNTYPTYGTTYPNYTNTSYGPTQTLPGSKGGAVTYPQQQVYPWGIPQNYGNGYQSNYYPNALVVDTFPQTPNAAQNYYYGYPTGDSTLFYPICYQPAYGDYASCYFDATQPVRDTYTGRVY